MLKEILDTKVLIVGAGISGLSLAYFLLKENIKDIIIIDQKNKIGYPIKDTGLVSNRIFDLLPLSKKVIYDKFREAEFIYGKNKFYVRAKRGYMVLLNRDELDIEVYDKIKNKIKVILGEKILDINKNNRLAITNNYKIKYDVIVDATGPFSIVRKLYRVKTNNDFVFGMEALTNISGHSIKIFLDKSISNEYFAWIINTRNFSKVGLIDKKLNINKFRLFLKKNKIANYKILYSDIIKYKPETILAFDRLISVGESTGYIKQFSLGGIIFSIIQARVASFIIKNFLEENIKLEQYNYVVKKLFSKYTILGNIIRLILKSKELFKIIKILKINKLANLLDLDFYTPIKIEPGPGGI